MMQKPTKSSFTILSAGRTDGGGQGVRVRFDSPALKPSGRSTDGRENKNDSGSLGPRVRDVRTLPAPRKGIAPHRADRFFSARSQQNQRADHFCPVLTTRGERGWCVCGRVRTRGTQEERWSGRYEARRAKRSEDARRGALTKPSPATRRPSPR